MMGEVDYRLLRMVLACGMCNACGEVLNVDEQGEPAGVIACPFCKGTGVNPNKLMKLSKQNQQRAIRRKVR